jgi:hypothetical protein
VVRVRTRAATFRSKWCAYAGERQLLSQSLHQISFHKGGPGAPARGSQTTTVRRRTPKGSPKEAQTRPQEVQRRRIQPGTHKRPKVKSATKKNIDFTRVFDDPGLGGVGPSIRLCREAALAQISRAVPKTSEMYTFECLAWKTMLFTS